MFGKAAFAVTACAAFEVIACAGPLGGKGQGESCTRYDECAADLTCQPVAGHGDVCCPTPPDSSSSSGCQAEWDGG